MSANGQKMVSDTVEDSKYGRMDQNTRATGRMIWPTAKEGSSILMGMCMRVSGSTIRLMEEELISIWTGLNIMESGEKISNMASE